MLVQTPMSTLTEGDLTVSVIGLSTLPLSFPLQTTPGDYSVQVGPQILNLFGTAMSQTYTGSFTVVLPVIEGTVTDTNGQPVAGVTIQPSFGSAPSTDAAGHYTLGFIPGLSISVTPSLGSLVFLPGMRTYTNATESVTGEDYLAVTSLAPAVTGGGSGTNLWLSWHGLPGVTYQAWWSTNLADWLPYGDPLPGTNGTLDLVIPMDADPQKFFRIGAVN